MSWTRANRRVSKACESAGLEIPDLACWRLLSRVSRIGMTFLDKAKCYAILPTSTTSLLTRTSPALSARKTRCCEQNSKEDERQESSGTLVERGLSNKEIKHFMKLLPQSTPAFWSDSQTFPSSSPPASENDSCVPSILLSNARSIAAHGKLDDMSLPCSSLGPDFCIVIETWLNKSHDSSYFLTPNYSLLRKDRVGRLGDVAVWLKKGIICSVLSNPDFPHFVECLCLSFQMINKDYLLCALQNSANMSSISDALVNIVDTWSNDHIEGEDIIAGDQRLRCGYPLSPF